MFDNECGHISQHVSKLHILSYNSDRLDKVIGDKKILREYIQYLIGWKGLNQWIKNNVVMVRTHM